MMRKARELYDTHPGEVIFLDFEGHDFDQPAVLHPVTPTRAFWERVLRVALDDLAELVAPREIVICEGNPKSPVGGKNEEHDARCFEIIFAEQYPDTKFISGGGSKDVASDRLRFAAVFPHVVKGVTVRRVIDRDDHAPQDVTEFQHQGIRTLRRRNLESYLFDEEVLRALYQREGRIADFPALQAARAKALADAASRNFPVDDIKAASRDIYLFAKQHLRLTGCGNDPAAFARNVLAPLVKPGTAVYEELREDILDR
jgi:hypothetical protein